MSILLLGSSGVGKSQSLNLARKVTRAAVAPTPGVPPRLGWHDGSGTFTPRGLITQWSEVQQRDNVDYVEGIHIEGEIANIVTQRKGSETISTWLIQALEHEDLVDYTGMYGRTAISGITVAFGLGSTVEYLRRALSPDEFAGGFMHRFFIAVEDQPDKLRVEQAPTREEVVALAAKLREVRNVCPPELGISPAATRRLDLIRRQDKWYDHHRLAGFWNRFDGFALRLAQLFTIAQGRSEVAQVEVDRAVELLRRHCYPPLETLVDQVSATFQKKELLDIADSLKTSGPRGWSMRKLLRRIGRGESARTLELVAAMEEQGLLFRRGARVYRYEEWAKPTNASSQEDGEGETKAPGA